VIGRQNNSQALAVVSDSEFENVGPDQDTTAEDILIPRILCMQPLSPKVVDGEYAFGELRDNMNWELLASAKHGDAPAKSLVVLPFQCHKYWIQKKLDEGQYKFEEMIWMDHTNDKLNPFEEWKGEDGVARKREYLHLFYVLLKDKPLPYTIGFKGASHNAGKALYTQMYTVNKGLKNVEAFVSSPMGKLIEVTPVKLKKGNKSFMAIEVKPFETTKREQAVEALTWYKNVSSGKAKADLSNDDDDAVVVESKEF